MMRTVADPQLRPCKICAQLAPLIGVVDFSKNCEERRGMRLPLVGVPIYYRRCGQCGFLFTEAFDAWSPADFAQHIYNADYSIVDQDYLGARAAGNAQFTTRLFGSSAAALAVLDYGGGDGLLAQHLRAAGFAAVDTYDPFVPEHRARPARKYNLVTCFEVLEHAPDPMSVAAEIADCLGDEGMVLASTLVQPEPFPNDGLAWWYVSPRNGHISIHSRASLGRMWAAAGLTVAAVSDNLHVAFRKLRAYAAPVMRIQAS
jgi:2-polyprenyl-3-methyl-5-hydroxy-6-metoxy-1,4-benzoquinol methylase